MRNSIKTALTISLFLNINPLCASALVYSLSDEGQPLLNGQFSSRRCQLIEDKTLKRKNALIVNNQNNSQTKVEQLTPLEGALEQVEGYCREKRINFNREIIIKGLKPYVTNYALFMEVATDDWCYPFTIAETLYKGFKAEQDKSGF
jgi:hypothetical protein